MKARRALGLEPLPPMSKPDIKKVFPFRSKSDPSKSYECTLYVDNTTSCNCPGWTRRVAANGTRECKHTQMVEGGLDGGAATKVLVTGTLRDGQSRLRGVTKPQAQVQQTGRKFNFD